MSQNISLLKICPFMSTPTSYSPGLSMFRVALGIFRKNPPYPDLMGDFVPCQEGRCSAWIEPCDIYREDFHEQGNTMQECPAFERDCEQSRPCCVGYCILIHPRGRS